jgi:NAD(P)H-dependent flavin oxidoreductase YrpB (nitropropane dioxygenase family)
VSLALEGLRRFGRIRSASDAVGDVESMHFLAGQAVGLVQEVKPAAEIIRKVAERTERMPAGLVKLKSYPETGFKAP